MNMGQSKPRSNLRRIRAGKLVAASFVCVLMFSSVSDIMAINTYVRDLKGLAIPVQTYNVEAPVVALTFDIGGAAEERVPEILLQLKRTKTKATFFLTGQWVEKHPQTAKAIVREGHEVGRSLYTYRGATELTTAEVEAEIAKTDRAWQQAGLPEGHLFRVPFGETKGEIAKVIRARHEQLISWSINAAPKTPDQATQVLADLEKSLHPGDVLRLQTDAASLAVLPELLKRVKKAGYEIRPIQTLQDEVTGE